MMITEVEHRSQDNNRAHINKDILNHVGELLGVSYKHFEENDQDMIGLKSSSLCINYEL